MKLPRLTAIDIAYFRLTYMFINSFWHFRIQCRVFNISVAKAERVYFELEVPRLAGKKIGDEKINLYL